MISQQVEEENQCVAPVQLVSFNYRDLPLAAVDVSLAGSQLISNPDEEDNREGSVSESLSHMFDALHDFVVLSTFCCCCFAKPNSQRMVILNRLALQVHLLSLTQRHRKKLGGGSYIFPTV